MNEQIKEQMEEQMTDAQRRMVEDTMFLAKAMAWKYRRTNVLIEDLEQAAYLALCEVAMSYDPGKEVSFGTYAYPYIRQALRQEASLYTNPMRMRRRDREKIAVASIDGGQGSLELQSLTDGVTAESQMGLTELSTAMLKAFDTMTNREKYVILAMFGWEGETESVEDVARALDTSLENAHRLEHLALNRMERILEREGVI